ncbi:MAG TPA: primosomal protein N', partial [Planctomycetaceae bacterium]|nr:primosomal protein N' [Planctomycetaceae bacterium]
SFPPDPLPWEVAAENDRMIARLVFNRPVDSSFDYLVPDGLRTLIAPGQRVKAPFGKGDRTTVGYCVEIATKTDQNQKRLKTIESILDRQPLVSASMLRLTRWIADYYLCTWGQVLESVVPAGVKQQAGTRLVTSFVCADRESDEHAAPKLSAKQKAVLEILTTAGRPMDAAELTQAADCGTAPLSALRQKGLIRAVRQRQTLARPEDPSPREADLQLNVDQRRALDTILGLERAGQHRTVLLHGVTGSGKTEVYIQAIREVVSYGRQAIVLVPEISLTPQTIRRFRRRFTSVAVLHSHLSDAERHWHWQQIASGSVEVVIGARSAVFAPTPNLGLIVIDEEHETTFKQETTPRYHARDVARERARLENIPLILGSATPTLESWQRVQQGPDALVSLPQRVERRPLPPVIVVDVRNDPLCRRGAAIGRALEQAMRNVLRDDASGHGRSREGGQIILFLNLRGFSPAIWCRSCGASVKCPTCDVTLAWHKDRGKALCHVCDYECDPPAFCPACNHAGLRYVGIGTQRLEQEVRARFPGVSCVRMDSDSMRKRGSHDTALEQFRHGEARILLGTQMIAKGLDFPNVTLVGVVNADTILHQPDFRASERTFQLISQVSGRTGRGPRGGRVLVQTSAPDEPAIVLASKHDYATFVKQEWGHRQALLAPPCRQFTRIIVRGEDAEAVREEARRIAKLCTESAASHKFDVRLLGPAPAPVSRIKGQYRFHVLLAAPQGDAVRIVWREVVSQLSPRDEVEWTVDVDPINLR